MSAFRIAYEWNERKMYVQCLDYTTERCSPSWRARNRSSNKFIDANFEHDWTVQWQKVLKWGCRRMDGAQNKTIFICRVDKIYIGNYGDNRMINIIFLLLCVVVSWRMELAKSTRLGENSLLFYLCAHSTMRETIIKLVCWNWLGLTI